MMNCKQATRLMSDAQERDLSLKERAALKLHVMMCSGCKNFGQQMKVLSGFAHAYVHGDAATSNTDSTAEKPVNDKNT